jgi:predicted metallo-beta-lactamase superfamily hydrolase
MLHDMITVKTIKYDHSNPFRVEVHRYNAEQFAVAKDNEYGDRILLLRDGNGKIVAAQSSWGTVYIDGVLVETFYESFPTPPASTPET